MRVRESGGMTTLHIRLTKDEKDALYDLARDVGAIGQQGPSPNVLIRRLAQCYIVTPNSSIFHMERLEQARKIGMVIGKSMVGLDAVASPTPEGAQDA